MNREQVMQRISEYRDRAGGARHIREAAELATEAVRAGGVPIVEITMTVPGAVGSNREAGGLRWARTS